MMNMKKILLGWICIFTFVCCSNQSKVSNSKGCSFETEELVLEIMQMFDADSVNITTKKFRLEANWPSIKAPVIEIFNPRMKSLDFKTLTVSMRELDSLDDKQHLRDKMEEELKPIAKNVVSICNANEYNEILVEVRKIDATGKNTHRFCFSYNYLLKSEGKETNKAVKDADEYLRLRTQINHEHLIG